MRSRQQQKERRIDTNHSKLLSIPRVAGRYAGPVHRLLLKLEVITPPCSFQIRRGQSSVNSVTCILLGTLF